MIPRFLTERSALKLVYGVLIRASARWRQVRMGEAERHQLGLIRESLGIAEKEEVPCLVWAIRFYRGIGT